MKLKIRLKEPHKEFIDKVISDHSISDSEKAIHKLIHGILKLNKNDDIFGEYRCVGDCYSNDHSVDLDMDEVTFSKIKSIFQEYDFDDYETEDEEISKIIRSMINFSEEEDEGTLKDIFQS